MREEKPPLKLHYRLSFLTGYRKLERTLAYRSCGTKEGERERGREVFVFFFFVRWLVNLKRKVQNQSSFPKRKRLYEKLLMDLRTLLVQ